MELGDLKLGKDGTCWVLVSISRTAGKIILIWKEQVKYFMENNWVFVPHLGYKKLIDLIEPGKYPRTAEDLIEIYNLCEVRRK